MTTRTTSETSSESRSESRIDSARQFMEGTARVLERRQLEVFLDAAPVGPVLDALRPYRNPDGGFGHALEPDVRCPGSQPSAALTALGVLAEIGATNDPMVTATADWVASVARPDGGVAQVLPSALGHPRTPWMEPNDESSFLTFAIAGRLHQLGVEHPWLDAATAWSWRELEAQKEAGGYTVEFALQFLDAVPDPDRAAAAIDRLRPSIRPDGTVPVPGGIEGEHIKPLELSPRPEAPSRALFTPAQIDADLDRLEGEQLDDGGWDFHFLHWMSAQSTEWRGIVTLGALNILREHGRL
ncbi:hypothetical protein OOK29_30265 [Streptomyces phaeochromogenes]|uniref:hypothetical protein n=1 Tax=Streptomyces phaeochromogenes TaxID=1923 RepID=UPI00225B2924|nr:hypothetical protein [Streptomyces phaeochromogenes]MCX5602453.1 hypothetical protein [Streptomyces phaeochromogenes]